MVCTALKVLHSQQPIFNCHTCTAEIKIQALSCHEASLSCCGKGRRVAHRDQTLWSSLWAASKSKGTRDAALAQDTEAFERKHTGSYNVISANSIMLPMVCTCLLRAGSTSQLPWSLQLEQEQNPQNSLIPGNISHQANRTSIMCSWWDLLEPQGKPDHLQSLLQQRPFLLETQC